MIILHHVNRFYFNFSHSNYFRWAKRIIHLFSLQISNLKLMKWNPKHPIQVISIPNNIRNYQKIIMIFRKSNNFRLFVFLFFHRLVSARNGCCNCWSEIRLWKWTNSASRLPPNIYQCCYSTFFIINILPSIYNHIYYLHLLTSSHSWTFNVSMCYLSISLPCYALVVGILKKTWIYIQMLVL